LERKKKKGKRPKVKLGNTETAPVTGDPKRRSGKGGCHEKEGDQRSTGEVKEWKKGKNHRKPGKKKKGEAAKSAP